MGIALNDEIRRLLDGRHFAVLATLNPDGGAADVGDVGWPAMGDDVLFSTVAGRRKHRNLVRDPRASVTILDSDEPYNYVELRGRRDDLRGREPRVRHRAVVDVRRRTTPTRTRRARCG